MQDLDQFLFLEDVVPSLVPIQDALAKRDATFAKNGMKVPAAAASASTPVAAVNTADDDETMEEDVAAVEVDVE